MTSTRIIAVAAAIAAGALILLIALDPQSCDRSSPPGIYIGSVLHIMGCPRQPLP